MDRGWDPPPGDPNDSKRRMSEERLSSSDPLSLLSPPSFSSNSGSGGETEGPLFASSGSIPCQDCSASAFFSENPFLDTPPSTRFVPVPKPSIPHPHPRSPQRSSTNKPAPLLRSKSSWRRPTEKKRAPSPDQGVIGGRGMKPARLDKERDEMKETLGFGEWTLGAARKEESVGFVGGFGRPSSPYGVVEEKEKETEPQIVPEREIKAKGPPPIPPPLPEPEWNMDMERRVIEKRGAISFDDQSWPKELFARRDCSPRRDRPRSSRGIESIALGLGGSERPQVSFRTAAMKPACFSVWDMDDFVEFNCGPEKKDSQFMPPRHIFKSRANGFQLDRRRTELEIRRDDGRKRGSLYQFSHFNETPMVSDLYQPSLFAPAKGYMTESYFDLSSSPDFLGALLIDQERYTPYYRHCFYRKEHSNFMAFSEDGPMFISAEKTSFDPSLPSVPCRVFLRTCLPWSSETEADIWVVVNPTEKDDFKLVLERELSFFLNTTIDRIVELQEASQELFLKLEDSLMVKNYKLGVLSWNTCQKTEDEIFTNMTVSPDYQEFLEFLGEVVKLEGWPYFRAGLDVKSNTTGKESLFTRYLDYEVMYHVGAFLPHGEGKQQLGKKRHIGNDIVVIVFKERDGEDVLFDPSIFVSDFNHIFVIVEKVSNDSLQDLYEKNVLSSFHPSRTYYRVGFCSKGGVHSSEPALCFPGIYEKNDNFRHFLLTKVLNSERSALYAQKFVTKMAKTRTAVFLDIAEDCVKLMKKKEKSNAKNLARFL